MGLSICAIYLAEWIEFHRLIGVEQFCLYENNSDDGWESVVRPYVREGIVEVRPWRMAAPAQLAAFRDFVGRNRGSPQWVAFIDCDEFLFSPTQTNVTELLTAPCFQNYGAVAVH